mmetsp:Transcript_14279/g.53761  ORF Transcript_14279/g.53761 Transcript_14279/m.53761 type:complete len:501 (-) Transcript_14279:56-1558(-)
MEYRRLQAPRFASVADRDSVEAKYWRRFRTLRVEHLIGVGSTIHFSSNFPYDFSVTNGARVSLYHARTNRSRHALSRFGATAYSAKYREDGLLLAAGDGNGRVRVFDVARRNLLRDFKGHSAAARCVVWNGKTEVLSGADDMTLRKWSLTTQGEVDRREAHEDYVRCLWVPQASRERHFCVSGGYDHFVKLWDWRTPKAVAKADCGAPVESLIMAQGGHLVYAAAGNTVHVWDMLAGMRKIHEFSNHSKAITYMEMDTLGQRLLTSSLDGHVKVVNPATFDVMHSMRFPAGVISVSLSPDNFKLVAALEDGSLVIRRRNDPNSLANVKERRRVDRLKGGTYSFFSRGKNAVAAEGDVVIAVGEKQRLKPYDKALQRFKYMEGLDLALATKNAITIISVLKELKMRRGLRIAIGGRTDEALEPLLSFLVANITNPRYAPLLLEVTNSVLDIYGDVAGSSMLVDELLERLHKVVRQEIRGQSRALELMGALEAITTASRLMD